jgi:hypothetical protein
MARVTPEDDQWAWNNLRKPAATESGSYRYADENGVVHRAVWTLDHYDRYRWISCCGERIVEKLQEGDAGAITCARCLGAGA